MENVAYIDDYFNSSPTDEQKQQFALRINNDILFADEVAFYIAAQDSIKEALAQEKKIRFKEIYRQQQIIAPVVTMQPVRKLWKYMAAASVVVAIMLLSWFLFSNKTIAQQLADTYIQQNFKTLGVTMGSKKDSLQTGLDFNNEGKLNMAFTQFESMVKNDSTNDAAKKYAGVVSLRLNDYDKALYYFKLLGANTALYSNPGKFYEAVTLLKRNSSGDNEKAKKLLQEIIEKDLEGKEIAEEWIKKIRN